MAIRQCGTCEFWDREDKSRWLSESWKLSYCLNSDRLKKHKVKASLKQFNGGVDCNFYKERQDAENVE